MEGDCGGQIFLYDKTPFLSSHSDHEKSPLYDSKCLGNLPALFCDSHIYLAVFLWEKGTSLTSIVNIKLVLILFLTPIGGLVCLENRQQGIGIDPKTFSHWLSLSPIVVNTTRD